MSLVEDSPGDGGLVRLLLPGPVAVAEGPILQLQEPLCSEEEPAVARAVLARQQEFRAGRTAARRALEALGAPRCSPIPASPERAPVWPAAFVGSIAHTRTYVAAAVARAAEFASVGIDLEIVSRFDATLADHILTPWEMANPFALSHEERLAAVFCAKEAFYKAQHPLTGRWLGFHDVEVVLDSAAGVFAVRLTAAPAALPLEGRFLIAGDWAAAAFPVPAGEGPRLAEAVLRR